MRLPFRAVLLCAVLTGIIPASAQAPAARIVTRINATGSNPCLSGYSPGLWAGGGGASRYYSKPAWQAGVPGIPNDGARDVPDVALSAADPYLICLRGSCQPNSQCKISFYGYAGTCGGLVLPGQSCTLTFTFTPTVPGPSSGYPVWTANTSPNNFYEMTLTGTGVATPIATVSATALDFGTQKIVTRSATRSFTITNSTAQILNTSGIGLSGANWLQRLILSTLHAILRYTGAITLHDSKWPLPKTRVTGNLQMRFGVQIDSITALHSRSTTTTRPRELGKYNDVSSKFEIPL